MSCSKWLIHKIKSHRTSPHYNRQRHSAPQLQCNAVLVRACRTLLFGAAQYVAMCRQVLCFAGWQKEMLPQAMFFNAPVGHKCRAAKCDWTLCGVLLCETLGTSLQFGAVCCRSMWLGTMKFDLISFCEYAIRCSADICNAKCSAGCIRQPLRNHAVPCIAALCGFVCCSAVWRSGLQCKFLHRMTLPCGALRKGTLPMQGIALWWWAQLCCWSVRRL